VALRVDVNPDLLVWARERGGVDIDELGHRFPHLYEWELGRLSPTLKQLESFARATHTPIGYLLLDRPPEEQLPIADYRTRGDVGVERPSADLLDTIFVCQLRQGWYRDFAEAEGDESLPFVGSLTIKAPVAEAAVTMRKQLRFEISERGANWTEALRTLVDRAEENGIIVMLNSIVGSDTHRKLNPDEFGGFALADDLAPLVFVNAADTRAAQIFTLAHELAHLWIGESALSKITILGPPDLAVERWCNRVAAEFLVPLAEVKDRFDPQKPLTDELERLAKVFKTSTLVVLGRINDAGYIDPNRYRDIYADELARIRKIIEDRDTGTRSGNFFNTLPLRVSRRFAQALVASTIEGQTSHRDALRMLGFRKLATFDRFAHELGIR
jgi:Zn-dependent peptidase ImmA (M78 family)